MALKTSLVIAGDSTSAVAALDALEGGLSQAGATGARAGAQLEASFAGPLNAIAANTAATNQLIGAMIAASTASMQRAQAASELARADRELVSVANELARAERAAATEQAALAAAAANLRSQLDPLYDAQVRFDREMTAAEQLYKSGAFGVREYAAAQELARNNLRSANDAIHAGTKAANDNEKQLNRAAFGARNAGQQFGDFGLQVASGQSVALAFSQQIGQLGYAMSEMGGKAGAVGAFLTGPWGIALTIAAAVAAPFIERLIQGGEKAEDLADKLDKAASAADSFGNAQSLVGKVVDLTTGKLKSQNTVLIEYIKLAAQANIVAAQKQQRDASAALKGQGRIGVAEAAPGIVAGVAGFLAGGDRDLSGSRSIVQGLSRQAQALKPLRTVVDDYAAAINRVDLSRLSNLKPGELDGVAAKIGTLTTGAIAQLDKLGASGKLAGRDLITTKQSVLDLGKAVQDQIANQLAINAADGKGVSAFLRPYEKPKKDRKKKGPTQASLDASALGISDRIAGLEDQYAELPAAIKKANDQLRELGKIKADIDKQPLLPGAEALKARIAALEPVIRDSLNKPFDDYLKQQRQSAEIDRLLIQGREDEAAALQDVLRLQTQMGPLSEQQVRAVIQTVQQERQRAMVLRDQRALIQGNIAAVQSFRGALEQTVADALRGRFSLKNILSSLGNSFLNIAAQRIVESVFGSTLRALEAKATGSDKVQTAATSIASSLGKGSSAAESFASSLDSAASSIRNAAARIDGKPTPAAKDNGGTASIPANDNGEGDIVVVGNRPPKLSGQGAVEQIYGIAEATLRAIGIKTPPIIGDVIKGTLGKLEKSLPTLLAGAVSGATSSRIILGDRGTTGTIGASIGGAIGEKVGEKVLSKGLESVFKGLGQFGGPIGSIVGGLLGGVIGGLFQSKPRGSAAVTQDSVSVNANKDSVKSNLNTLGGQLQSAVQTIADRLGASVGNYDVGFGAYKDYFQVSNSGSDRFLGQTSYAAKSSQSLYDGKDAAAALSAAIANAVSDGAIEGVSSKVAAALRSNADIDKAVAEALKVKDLETALGGVAAQLANEVKAFEKTASDRLRLAKTYGFDIVKVEELNAKQRLALSDKLLRDQVGSLQDLITELTSGSLFEGTAVDKRTALLDQIAAVRADANAGVEGAADKLAKLLDQLNTTSKDVYGTTGGFATDQQSILDAARQAIAAANQRVTDAQKGSDPALAETNAQLNESNDQLAKISAYTSENAALLRQILGGMGLNDNGSGNLRELAQIA